MVADTNWPNLVLAARGEWSQARLAKWLRMSQQAVATWEAGAKTPRGPRAEDIARKLATRLRSLEQGPWTTQQVLEVMRRQREGADDRGAA